jgi:hypothetical protein
MVKASVQPPFPFAFISFFALGCFSPLICPRGFFVNFALCYYGPARDGTVVIATLRFLAFWAFILLSQQAPQLFFDQLLKR